MREKKKNSQFSFPTLVPQTAKPSYHGGFSSAFATDVCSKPIYRCHLFKSPVKPLYLGIYLPFLGYPFNHAYPFKCVMKPYNHGYWFHSLFAKSYYLLGSVIKPPFHHGYLSGSTTKPF